MNRIIENYEIATEAYDRLVGRKNFYLRDDLIQEAVLRLMQKQNEYNASRAAYRTWAKRIATNYMRDILDKHRRHLHNPSMFDFVGDNLRFEDILSAAQITPHDILDCRVMYKTIAPLFENKNLRVRQIIALHLKHYTQREIAWKIGTTQQYVSKVVEQFRNAAAELLGVDRRDYR